LFWVFGVFFPLIYEGKNSPPIGLEMKLRKLVSFLHHMVVEFVELQPSERLWTAYGSRFEHQGQTFWDWAYYTAERIDRKVRI